jgi:bacterioferritin-associated ferredoxin
MSMRITSVSLGRLRRSLVREGLLYICICNAVTQRQVEECARAGVNSLDELACTLGVGAGCGRCRECAVDVLRGIHGCDEDAALAAAK